MTIYGMTKKRVSPEINAVSTLLFVTVHASCWLSSICGKTDQQSHSRRHAEAAAGLRQAPKKHPGLGKKIAAACHGLP